MSDTKSRKAIITEYMDSCLICGRSGVEIHHAMSGIANRPKADADGLVMPLCPVHHNSSNMSVHLNKEMKWMSRMIGQLAWEKEYYKKETGIEGQDPARVAFMKRYGKSYL